MAFKLFDMVRESSTTTGTGAVTLAGALNPGQTFASRYTVGDTCWYRMAHVSLNEWETGFGTYSGANTLTRTAVLQSSNADAAVNFSAGSKRVEVVRPSEWMAGSTMNARSGGLILTGSFTMSGSLTVNSSGAFDSSGAGYVRVSGTAPVFHLKDTDVADTGFSWRCDAGFLYLSKANDTGIASADILKISRATGAIYTIQAGGAVCIGNTNPPTGGNLLVLDIIDGGGNPTSVVAGHAGAFTKLVGGVAKLFGYDGNGAVTQLTP